MDRREGGSPARFLSARVTNYQYNPFLGVLLDQLHIYQQPSSRHRPTTQS